MNNPNLETLASQTSPTVSDILIPFRPLKYLGKAISSNTQEAFYNSIRFTSSFLSQLAVYYLLLVR